MIPIDTSNWSAELLSRRPNAPEAIQTAIELLGVSYERRQDVADDIYIACVMYFSPLEIGQSRVSPRDIWTAIENIAKAAETIEKELVFLGSEARPLPPNLGSRSIAVRHLRREIVRALGERLVPPILQSERVRHTLPHQFPESYINPGASGGHHAWEGQFQQFANTVRDIRSYLLTEMGDDGMRRRPNRPDFAAVQLVSALGHIFENETGRKALAYREPDNHTDNPGVSAFTDFVKAVWAATEHPPITVFNLKTFISEADKFPG